MRTVADFKCHGRSVYIRAYASLGPRGAVMYRAYLDGEEIPYSWPNPKELEAAVRALLDEEYASK